MRKIAYLIFIAVVAVVFSSCEANDETYDSFLGDWHLLRINANGEYRTPKPAGDTCFNLHFLKNNSMVGESVSSGFSAIYNVKKRNRILWSGFTYQPAAEDSTDNVVFINNMLKVNSYDISRDTLKLKYEGKTYMSFIRVNQ